MDNESIREFCLKLPHVVETLNWGHVLDYWVGDRETGGKMFALTALEGTSPVLSLHCGAERFHELLEIEGIMGAPHLARAYWVALERWDSLRPREIEEELTRAHALIYEKLPKRTKSLLALPQKQRPKGIKEGKNSRAKSLVVPRAKK
jgi:predicted DNA-binding protein (MmcQ/YjbR family)